MRVIHSQHNYTTVQSTVKEIYNNNQSTCETPASAAASGMDTFETQLQYRDARNRVIPCEDSLRHKNLLVNPNEILKHGCVVELLVQTPGRLVVTLPGAWHSGFNAGNTTVNPYNKN
jgi:hypothetical protein